MKKHIAIILTIVFMCLAAFALSGCGISRFTAYNYEDGIMLFLDGDETNFYAEFDFVTYNVGEYDADRIDAYLLDILKNQYGDLIEYQETNYYQETDAYGETTGKTIFYYYYTRPITDADTDYYRYDPKLIRLRDFIGTKGFYYNDYSVSYDDPRFSNPVINLVLNGEYANYFNAASNPKLMLACGRRDVVSGGTVKAVELSYWAEYKDVTYTMIDLSTGEQSQLAPIGYNFSYMVSWSWYLTVILITGIVIGLILLLAKKRDGKIVAAKQKNTYRRPPYGYPPYGNPNNQNPYGNPYNNPNNQNPFGSQYGNPGQPPYSNQQNPYGAPPQYPPYGNQQYPPYANPQQPPYGAPQYPQSPPQPPKPDDVFPGFGAPGEDEKK